MATCCSICFESFQSSSSSLTQAAASTFTSTINRVPRMLWCGHTFCTQCLSQLIPSTPSPSPSPSTPSSSTKETQIQCPIDRKITTLHPSNNNKSTPTVEELPINRAVIDMLFMLSFASTPSPSLPQSALSTSTSTSAPLKCQECEQVDAALHCQQCEASYCQACDEKLHSHKALRSHKKLSSALLASSLPIPLSASPTPSPPLPPSPSPSLASTTSTSTSSNLCQEHGDRIFEYCLTCYMPVCGLCIRYGSQNGQVKHDKHKLNLMNDAIAITRQSMETIQELSKVIE